MKKLLAFVVFILLVNIIIAYFLFHINPNSKKYSCEILNPDKAPCTTLMCFAKTDTLRLKPFDCKSIIISFDSLSQDPCKREQIIEKYQNIIEKILSSSDERFRKYPSTTRLQITPGTIRHCRCNADIFIYENDILEEFNIEGVIANANQESEVEEEGGSILLNYIFQSEGYVPEAIKDLVSRNDACFEAGNFDYSQKHIISTIPTRGGEDRSIDDTYRSWLSNIICNHKQRSCFAALEPLDTDNNKMTLAILDTGLDLLLIPEGTVYHEPFSTHSELGEDVIGWNFVDENNHIDDDNGHGSIVALSYMHGLNSKMVDHRAQQILPVKVLDDCGHGKLFDIVCGLYYAVDKKVDVINMSLGAYLDSCSLLTTAVNYAADSGIAIVTSAGNDSLLLSNIAPFHFPSHLNGLSRGDYKSRIFEIGATCTNPMLLDNPISSMWLPSNYRPVLFAEAGIHYELLLRNFIDIRNLDYSLDGTSFATPLFSAAVMNELIKNRRPVISTDVMINKIGAPVNVQRMNENISIYSYYQ